MKANATTGKPATAAGPARPAVRAAVSGERAATDPMALLALQPTMGNRAVRSLLDAATVPLPDAGAWSQRLHADLSGVRIATGPDAERATAAMNARALTLGRTVLFGAGAYQPGTPEGQHRIAHELAHTLQNAGAPAAGALMTTRPGDPREQEAHHIADAVAAGQRPPRATRGPTMLAGDWQTPSPVRPRLWEPRLLAILRMPARDDVAAGRRRDALLVALAAVPEQDRAALVARLEHPAAGDPLAQLFHATFTPTTVQLALDTLRRPAQALDEASQPAALRTFLAKVIVRQTTPEPMIDRAWRREVEVGFQGAGARAPDGAVLELAWKVTDRGGRLHASGSVGWAAGAESTHPVTTRVNEPGVWFVTIDLITGGQVIKQITHVVTVAAASGVAALRGTTPADNARAAAQLSDEQITQQARILREELKSFDRKAGKELARDTDYRAIRQALDALEWQAALRALPGHTVDTVGPAVPDGKPALKNPAPLIDSVDRHNRGAVRERVEALIRRDGMAGARKQIHRARNISSDDGRRFGRTYDEFMEELEALAALHKDLLDKVAQRAPSKAHKMLATNRELITRELKKYGIVKVGDHRMGVGAYQGPKDGPNEEMVTLAQELHQLEQLRRRAFGVDPHRIGVQPLPPEEQKAAEQHYELALQAAIMRHPTILAFSEAARQQYAPRFTRVSGPEAFGGTPNLAPWIGWELNQKLLDIDAAEHKLDSPDDKLSIWSLPPVIEETKHELGIAPGTVASAVVDDHLQDPHQHGWNDSLLMVFTLALGALLALPTGGASLIVAAGELTLLATDLYLFQKQINEYAELKGLANTAIDPAHALLAEAPESADLLLPLLTLPVAGMSTLKRLGEAKQAAQSIRSLRTALAHAAGNRAHAEVVEAIAEARGWAMKAFNNDSRKAEAFLAKLLQRFGQSGTRIGVAIERGMTVAEYGADALARRLGVRRVTVVKDLEAVGSIEHAVEDGQLIVSEIKVSQATTVEELLDHAKSARAIEHYNGVIGKLRLTWDRVLDTVLGGRRVNPYRFAPSSPEFRAFEEIRKQDLILRARMRRLATALGKGDVHAANLLEDEIKHYEGERRYWDRRLNDMQDVKAGRSTRLHGERIEARSEGIEARSPKDVQDEALRKGYKKLPPDQRYRRTGSTVEGREFEPYDVKSSATELDEVATGEGAPAARNEPAKTTPAATSRAAKDPGTVATADADAARLKASVAFYERRVNFVRGLEPRTYRGLVKYMYRRIDDGSTEFEAAVAEIGLRDELTKAALGDPKTKAMLREAFDEAHRMWARGPYVEVKPGWAAVKGGCPNGCEAAAEQIKKMVGGDVHHFKSKPRPTLGRFDGETRRWQHHEVVVKDGRVYDMATGHQGLPIEDYKAKWEDRAAIDFGF